MPISTQMIFKRGGRELLDLLSHCVFAVNMDTMFLYLVGEYQLHPRASGAVALFDVFLAPQAPARIGAISLLPPKDMRIQNEVSVFRRSLEAACQQFSAQQFSAQQSTAQQSQDVDEERPTETGQENSPPPRPAVLLPPRYLFDAIARDLSTNANEKIVALESYYDPLKTPEENLPGGELNAVQRAFVDNVWKPLVRPHLVSSGFWRVATAG